MILKQLTYKQKNKYLIIGAVLFALVVYRLGISKTFDLYWLNKQLSQEGMQIQQSSSLETKLQKLNVRINDYTVRHESSNRLISIISEISKRNGILLKEFPKGEKWSQPNFSIETYEILFEGDFHKLLHLVYELEHAHGIGRVASIRFNSYRDHKKQNMVLSLTLFLQVIRM